MDIVAECRKKVETEIAKVVDSKIAKVVEASIFNYSKEYAEIQDTPYLFQEIYDDKANQILCQMRNQPYLIKSLKDKKIDGSKIAFMKPEELDPEKYESIIKKREMEEYKKNNTAGTNAFTCAKCKKARCKVSQKQTRAGDEPPTTFVNCLECGHSFKF